MGSEFMGIPGNPSESELWEERVRQRQAEVDRLQKELDVAEGDAKELVKARLANAEAALLEAQQAAKNHGF